MSKSSVASTCIASPESWTPNDTSAIKDDQKKVITTHHQTMWNRSRAESPRRSSCLQMLVSEFAVVSAFRFAIDWVTPVRFHKGSVSHVHFHPRPCSSTDRWARPSSHRNFEVRALMPTLASSPPHVCHRQGTGLSPQARKCSRTLTFLGRLNV